MHTNFYRTYTLRLKEWGLKNMSTDLTSTLKGDYLLKSYEYNDNYSYKYLSGLFKVIEKELFLTYYIGDF